MEEATEIVSKARQWRWKPYVEVTIRFSNDGRGAPIETMARAAMPLGHEYLVTTSN